MARDPDTIQREIERSRDALAASLDVLTARVNPKKLADALTEMLLEPGFRASAQRPVKLAFLQALQDIRRMFLSDGAADDRSDENLDLESMDAQKMEQSLDSIEQNPDLAGMFQHQGVPVGIGMGD